LLHGICPQLALLRHSKIADGLLLSVEERLSAFRSPRSDPTFRGHRVAQTGFQRYAGFRSREEHTSAEKVLSAMRQGFGGHIEASPQDSSRKGDKA
jgi:hypothetical protein